MPNVAKMSLPIVFLLSHTHTPVYGMRLLISHIHVTFSVLPKFEVTTTGPKMISFFDEEVRVNVCAS